MENCFVQSHPSKPQETIVLLVLHQSTALVFRRHTEIVGAIYGIIMAYGEKREKGGGMRLA